MENMTILRKLATIYKEFEASLEPRKNSHKDLTVSCHYPSSKQVNESQALQSGKEILSKPNQLSEEELLQELNAHNKLLSDSLKR